MRAATIKDIEIANINDPRNIGVIWKEMPLIDAPEDMKIVLTIIDEDLAVGKMQHSTCAVANSCTRESFAWKLVWRDIMHIAAYHKGAPVRLRFRSGELPRKFDRLNAMVKNKELDLDGWVQKLKRLRNNEYILRPPSKTQTLDAKRVKPASGAAKKTRIVTKHNSKRDIQGYLTRGVAIT